MSKDNNWTKWLVSILLIVILVIVSFLLFKTKETHVSNSVEKISRIDSVFCNSENLENVFFSPKQEGRTEHNIKITFKDEKPDKISYDFDGVYDSDDVAEAIEVELHAKYNIYMGERELSASMLGPIFSTADSKVKISLYANVKDLINTTVLFFFLDMDDFQKVRNYSVDEFAELYKNKGFSCTVLK